MKTISVLSDTHGNISSIEKIFPILKESDYVVHLGDGALDMKYFERELKGKLIYVRGNCDFSSEEKYSVLEIENLKILVTHGDLFGVKQSLLRLRMFAEENGACAAFYGHTHVAEECTDNGILLFNPGSLSAYSAFQSYGFVCVANGKLVCKINKLI